MFDAMKRLLPWNVALLSLLAALYPRCGAADRLVQEIPAHVAPRAASRPMQAYPFVHADGCTGVCEFVIVDGKSVPIEFTPDSDAGAMMLLYALKPEIFLPNTGEPAPRLYVVGQLFDGISRDAQGPGRAYDPGHHDFLLQRWYLATPFREDKRYSNDHPQMEWSDEDLAHYRPTLRRTLRRSDFERLGAVKPDLRELLRREAPPAQ